LLESAGNLKCCSPKWGAALFSCRFIGTIHTAVFAYQLSYSSGAMSALLSAICWDGMRNNAGKHLRGSTLPLARSVYQRFTLDFCGN